MARNRLPGLMKPFCGTRETILKQTGIKPAVNNGGKDAWRLR
jgi:hypothetical protein